LYTAIGRIAFPDSSPQLSRCNHCRRERDICGPALAEKRHEYIEVADVPGWREYEFPELKGEKR
jgi:hypothetical protein